MKVNKKRLNVRSKLAKTKMSYIHILDTGKIISIKDGIARVSGLFGVRSGEMVHVKLLYKKISNFLL
jgi:F0F1-type ATP synthase alpha subunit